MASGQQAKARRMPHNPRVPFAERRIANMKISQMTADHVADVLTTAAVELEPILEDKKLMSLSTDTKRLDDEPQLDYGMRVAKLLLGTVALFSKTYLQGIYRVLAAFFQCTPDEVGQMPLLEILGQVKDSLNDEVFLGFFPSLKPSAPQESSDTSESPAPSERRRRWFTSSKNSSKSKR